MFERLSNFFRMLKTRSEISLGEAGERAAVKYLRKKRYQVVETNVTTPVGEIDIVAVDGRVIVFVEVKTRRSTQKGEPWEAVDLTKRKKLLHPCRSLYETGRFE